MNHLVSKIEKITKDLIQVKGNNAGIDSEVIMYLIKYILFSTCKR